MMRKEGNDYQNMNSLGHIPCKPILEVKVIKLKF